MSTTDKLLQRILERTENRQLTGWREDHGNFKISTTLKKTSVVITVKMNGDPSTLHTDGDGCPSHYDRYITTITISDQKGKELLSESGWPATELHKLLSERHQRRVEASREKKEQEDMARQSKEWELKQKKNDRNARSLLD